MFVTLRCIVLGLIQLEFALFDMQMHSRPHKQAISKADAADGVAGGDVVGPVGDHGEHEDDEEEPEGRLQPRPGPAVGIEQPPEIKTTREFRAIWKFSIHLVGLNGSHISEGTLSEDRKFRCGPDRLAAIGEHGRPR